MTTKRKNNKKRQRNKSSPQTLSISKKHRQSEIPKAECETKSSEQSQTVINTDTESGADKSVLSDIRSVADSETDSIDSIDTAQLNPEMAHSLSQVANQDLDSTQMSQSILPNESGAPQYVNIDPGLVPPQGQQPPHPMMQQLYNLQAHMQHPLMIPQPCLSEDDIVRIAAKMKELLKEDIEQQVQQQVELKVAQRMAPLQDELNELKKRLAKVEKELKKALVRNDDLEQYSRRPCLRVSGIPETQGEDTTGIVLDLAKRCGAKIGVDDIDVSHRVGPGKSNTQDDGDIADIADEPQERKHREIIVKFRKHGARLQLLKGRAYFRTKKEKVYINEDLCKPRKNIAFACRQLRKNEDSPIVKTWVYNGNVYIQDKDDNKLRITSLDELEPFKPPEEDEDL